MFKGSLRLSSIAEHYNRRMAEAFEGLTGFGRIVDDVIIYDKDIKSHRDHVCTTVSTEIPRATDFYKQ